MDATLNALHQAQFSWTDVLRRAQGDAFEALRLGPNEGPYQVVASGSHWRLRDYTDHDGPLRETPAQSVRREQRRSPAN
jgi:hypothetical protein